MAAHQSMHLGQHTGRRRRSRRLPLALALLAALLVTCAMCALAAPAPADAAAPATAAPAFTPFAATVTAPTITVTSPSTSSGNPQDCAQGSLLGIIWTTSVPVPAGGEFSVWVEPPNYPELRQWETKVPANGGSVYGTWLLLDPKLAGGNFYVYVAYRRVAGSGDWVNTTARPGYFHISGVTFGLQTRPAGESHEAGSQYVVDWFLAPSPDLAGGEIGFWLKSSSGVYYLLKTASPAGAPHAPISYMDVRRTTLALDVPPGSGYQLVGAWRPNASGFWGSWSTSGGTLTITAAPTADLAGLVLSGPPANFTFAPATYSYSGISVPHAVTSVKVTPTGAGAITVDGTAVTSGQASKAITLKKAGSPTEITVAARETDKSPKTYVLEVTRNKQAPDTPAFNPESGALADGSKVTITADGADQIYYTIDGSTPTRASLRYQKGEPVLVHPTATKGLTLKALAVKKGHDDSAVGSTAYTLAATKDLTGLELSGHPANYSFARSTYVYAGITVAHSVSRVTVTPAGVGEITVNGTRVRSGRASQRPTSASVTLRDAGEATTITVIAKEDGRSAKTYTLAVTRLPDTSQSPDKDITAFSFASLSATGVIDQAKGTIAVGLPMGSDARALIATFTTTGASVSVGTKAQTSGVTANDFTALVTYTVRAADGSARSYVVTVTTSTTLSAPTFSPAGGNVAPGTLVTISCPGATTIAYTIDGTTVPSIDTATGSVPAGNRYSAPVPVEWRTVDPTTGRLTIQAMGGRPGGPLTPVVTATYTLVPTITPTAGSGGTITPGSAQAVKFRTSKSFAITPLEGYQIVDVLVDGSSVGAVSFWEFKDVKVDHTISATFALNASPGLSYTITPTAGAGGSISPATPQTVKAGGSLEFSIAADPGYRIADVRVDGNSIGVPASHRFTDVKASHTIAATFAKTGYTITPSAGAHGAISPATPQVVQAGVSLEFAITPDQGYRIADVLVDGVSVGAVAVHWFEQVGANHTISASFAPLTFTITPSAGQGGTISPATVQTLGYGGSQQFTITPDQGYHVVDVLVDSFSVGPVTSYPFTNVTQDHAISASFAVDVPLAITAFSFDGLTPAVPGIIDEGNHAISVIVPNGTDVTALVPTVAFTGDSVSPASGVGRDFTEPVTYTVTSGASSMEYTVTVTVSDPVQPGDFGFGGTVAYILTQGDPGYSATVQHGLAVAADDQSTGTIWALPDYQSTAVPGALATGIGDGAADTDAIIAQNGAGTGYAAGLARAYSGGGFNDWYLPSKGELNQLYVNRATVGITYEGWYWSSSQYQYVVGFYGEDEAWGQVFGVGVQQAGYKYNNIARVRAVRAF